MGADATGATWLLACRGRHRGEECPIGLGGIEAWGELSFVRECGLISKPQSVFIKRIERTQRAADAAARIHRCTACVDVKRVRPAPGVPDHF